MADCFRVYDSRLCLLDTGRMSSFVLDVEHLDCEDEGDDVVRRLEKEPDCILCHSFPLVDKLLAIHLKCIYMISHGSCFDNSPYKLFIQVGCRTRFSEILS